VNRDQLRDRLLTMIHEDDIDRAMRWIDEYTSTMRGQTGSALWDAKRVADFIGASSIAAARATLSRWGVEAVEYTRTESGRNKALYPATAVRQAFMDKTVKETLR
jgi:hypothetical protein